MKKNLLCLYLCLVFLCSGCNEHTTNNASENEGINMEKQRNISTEDINSVLEKNPSTLQNKVENNGLVTTTIEIISPSEIAITYNNETEDLFTYGSAYTLQVLNDEKWQDADLLPNIG